MIRFLNRFRRSDDGAALVETAIIVPVAFLLFAGGFELSRAIYVNQQIEKSVRGAGRYMARMAEESCGAVPTNAVATALVKGAANSGFLGLSDSEINSLAVTVSARTVDVDANNRVQYLLVQAALTYNVTVLSAVMPNPTFTINARHEEPGRYFSIPPKPCV